MKKKTISLFFAFVLVLGILPVYANEAKTFTDVPQGHPAYEAVAYLAGRDIISGKTKDKFYPDDNLKREEFAKILTLAASLESVEQGPVFQDVPAHTWFVPYVASVAKSGYMSGVSANTFGTGYLLTRQDLAVIIYRWAEKLKLPMEESAVFADSSLVADYAKEAVQKLGGTIMEARENHCFEPNSAATRAEAANAVYRLLMAVKENNDRLGRMSTVKGKYDGPYDLPEDKLQENIPTVFDASKWPTSPLFYEDFEDDDYSPMRLAYSGGDGIIAPSSNEGYEGSGCFKSVDGATQVFRYQNDSLQVGDYLVATVRLKGENISGSGNYRVVISIYDENGTWLTESSHGSGGRPNKTSRDWFMDQFIVSIPARNVDLNATEKRKYEVRISLYMENLKGTVYFDDLTLSTLLFEPMDTVLMTPNYKGIIRGEGGVGDIALRANISDRNGGYALENMRFVSKIVDEDDKVYMETASDTISERMDVYFSSKDLPMGGDYFLETSLVYRDTGEVVQKQSWTLRKREADFETKFSIDEDGRLIRNGKASIPTSAYHYGAAEDRGKILDVTDGTALTAYHDNTYAWWFNYGTRLTQQRDVKILEAQDKDIHMSTGPFYWSYNAKEQTTEIFTSVETQGDIRGRLGKIIEYWRDLPNLGCYYIMDEVSPVRYGEELRWYNEIVAHYDLDHPTWGAITEYAEDRPGIHAKTTDILVCDPYPVTGKSNQDLSQVTKFIEFLKETNPNRPVGVILQGFYYGARGDLRGPTEQEFRNMLWQSVIAGSCLIDVYAYNPGSAYNVNPGSTLEKDWGSFLTCFEEFECLKQAVLSDEPNPYYEIKGGGAWLNTMTRRYDGKSYLFAVNNQNTTKVARFKLDGVKEMTGMFSGETYKADANGWIEVEFDNIGVEVFTYNQADYLSPHAELERFGIMDAKGNAFVLLNSESETPSFLVEEASEKVDFSIQASDLAMLYINGEKVEKTGTIDIAGLSEIVVKIVSEDGRFSFEKTFALERK